MASTSELQWLVNRLGNAEQSRIAEKKQRNENTRKIEGAKALLQELRLKKKEEENNIKACAKPSISRGTWSLRQTDNISNITGTALVRHKGGKRRTIRRKRTNRKTRRRS